jgi:hypothetical protein
LLRSLNGEQILLHSRRATDGAWGPHLRAGGQS